MKGLSLLHIYFPDGCKLRDYGYNHQKLYGVISPLYH